MSQAYGLLPARTTPGTGGHATARRSSHAPLVLTSLSLNLILLAFFVVLNAVSQLDNIRVTAVLEEVRKTFGAIVFDDSGETVRNANKLAARDTLRDSVSAAFATVLSGRELILISRADRIDVTVPSAALIDPQTGTVRPALPLLDRIVSLLTDPAPNFRYELMVAADLSDTPSVMSAQVGAVAAALIERGLPRAILSAGRSAEPASLQGAFTFTFLVLDARDPLPVFGLTRGAV